MQYKSIIKIILLGISSISLSGCFESLNFKQMIPLTTTQSPILVEHKMTAQDAIWSKFIGYSPEAHSVRLSTFIEDPALLIAQQSKQISALSIRTGHHCWNASTAYTLTNPATTNHKMIFVTTSEPRLLALKATTGEVAWSVTLPNLVFAPAYGDSQQVIVKSVTGEVIAFNAKNGKQLWLHQHPYSSASSLHSSSGPIVHNQAVLVGFPDSTLLILDRSSGTKIFEHALAQPRKILQSDFQLSQFLDIATNPIIDGDRLYINAYQNKVQALSLDASTDYEAIWERAISSCKPLAVGKYLYILDDKNYIYALDKAKGNTIWIQKALHHRELVGPCLLTQQDKLVVADQEANIYWLSAKDGAILTQASFNVPSPILHVPLVRENTVYAITRKGQIAAWVDKAISKK